MKIINSMKNVFFGNTFSLKVYLIKFLLLVLAFSMQMCLPKVSTDLTTSPTPINTTTGDCICSGNNITCNGTTSCPYSLKGSDNVCRQCIGGLLSTSTNCSSTDNTCSSFNINNNSINYCSISGTWNSKMDILTNTGVNGKAATVSNKIYFLGLIKDNIVSQEMLSYKIQNDTWYTSEPELTETKYNMGVVSSGTNLYVLGGFFNKALASSSKFNTLTSTWSTIKSMPQGLTEFGAALLDENHIIIAGGYYLDANKNAVTVKSSYLYNIQTDTWTSLPDMPAPRASVGAGVIGNKFYIVGGSSDGNEYATSDGDSLFEFTYDSSSNTGTWSTKARLPENKSYPGVGVINGKLYAIGGINLSNDTVYNSDQVYEYDPNTNTWCIKRSLTPYLSNFAISVANNKIYIFGGWSGSRFSKTTYTKSTYEFDPAD